MTSRHLFLKGMREDLRHKVWILALSLLGSFLSMPVVWLLRYSDVDLTGAQVQIANMADWEYTEAIFNTVNAMADFFRQELMLSSSIIAILTAVVVGLESFRFLQQKSMVDTYYSLPVGRTQFFCIKYLNGLLIWLIPHLFCTVLTLVFSGVLLARVGGGGGISRLILEAGKNTVVLGIAFLLVYHMMLLATMLTGNMLNTLTLAVILGCGTISAYGLTLGFMSTFFCTYYAQLGGLDKATYTSPLAAPIILVGSRIDRDFLVLDGFLMTLLACLGVTLVLGALAWISYLKRPSERAGRGLDLPWLAWPIRLGGSILGGMGGWVFMYFLVGNGASSVAWCIFGALLLGIMTFGVLDVIFTMDFKAFFRHKWSMGASMVVMLLICAVFQEDWMGYDRYLPDQSQIREASIACRSYTNDSYSTTQQLLDGVRLTDAAQIHAFLERGIENLQGLTRNSGDVQVEDVYRGDDYARDVFYVRVVLENGKSYYRIYYYYKWDEDVVLPLLCSQEYAEGAYRLSEEQIESCISIRLTGSAGSENDSAEVGGKEVIRELAEAYNRDLAEQYQTVILGQGRTVGQMTVRMQRENSIRSINLNIFENMAHTLEALEENGIRIFEQPLEAEDVESITFQVDGSRYWYKGDFDISPVERSIRGHFGVYPDSLPGTSGDEAKPGAEAQASEPGNEARSGAETQVPPTYTFTVTAPDEIVQLLPLIQYSSPGRSRGVFAEELVENVSILDRRGVERSVCLRKGALPEELIQRFLEEAKDRSFAITYD